MGTGYSICSGAFLSLSHMVSASLNQRAVVGPVCLRIYPGVSRDQRFGWEPSPKKNVLFHLLGD